MENKANHCVYNINYHIVFCPKYRRKVINGKVEEIINQTVGKICESYGFSLIQMGTMPDHLHILLYAPPTVAPAEIVKTLKSITANTVFKTIPGIKKRGKFIVPNTENVAENLWRGAGRATTRALYRVDP
ncbi:IS200/IS605 family transposase, partial [Desulfotruncus alcoholivorax]|uniref:IS200/IS605 family transposase n=1 Tax=Desulfotruncus alcoholivorax TaxID=265477 RepID=UPI001A99E242